MQRNKLLHGQGDAFLQLDRELLPQVSRLFDRKPWSFDALPGHERLRPRSLRNVEIRLAGADRERDGIVADRLSGYRHEMLVVELAVQLRSGVHDASVDPGTHGDRPGPVL